MNKTQIGTSIFGGIVVLLLLYTRLINLDWGLPYPFHPDERNMANAVQQLNCEFRISNFEFPNWGNCFNPHFFAYGQLPLYLGYILIMIYKISAGFSSLPITFTEATLALRLLSVVSSILTAYILLRVLKVFLSESKFHSPTGGSNLKSHILVLPIIFSPFLIQFAHFGTTESILMLFYSSLFYFSLLRITQKMHLRLYLIISAVICGLSIGIKTSSILFLTLPVMIGLVMPMKQFIKEVGFFNGIYSVFFRLIMFALLSLFIMVISSPHTIISFSDFLNSMRYESAVALGDMPVFYTRQFDGTTPFYFQFLYIFPHTLGVGVWIYFLGGFILLPSNKTYNLLRISILAFLLPTAVMYAKWTRFMAPIMPLMLLMALLCALRLFELIRLTLHNSKYKVQNLISAIYNVSFYLLIFLFCLPGLAYLSVYSNDDVRFKASRWIFKNIPSEAYILSETANVVDIPIQDPKNNFEPQDSHFEYISFNFYDLEDNLLLQPELSQHIKNADYIFIPSRRVIANHTCLLLDQNLNKFERKRCEKIIKKYPNINKYYDMLLSQNSFVQIAEFNSYPHVTLFGKTLIEFPDENAEETWTVFDHPVIRIYKRI